jgi:hypothetical protein
MLSFFLRFTIITMALAAPALAAPEDEALQAFNSLYGEEVKRALATPDTADDAALAGKLLEAANSVSGQPALMAVLCEKAAELGKSNPAGRATAIQSLELLAEKVPDRKAACIEKIAGLRQAAYDAALPDAKAQAGEEFIAALLALTDAKTRAGDATAASDACRKALALAIALKSDSKASVQAKMEYLAAWQKTSQQVAALKARLQSAPTDAATRAELVKTLLVDLDDPAAAAKFVDTSLDATLQKFVPAAAKGVEQTPELACKELGDWYRGMADQAAGAAKAPLVARARAYYGRFLSLHAAEDLARAQVTLAAKKLDEAPAEVAKADPPKADTTPKPADTTPKAAGTSKAGATGKAAATGAAAAAAGDILAAKQWHDVLKYVDTNKDAVFGTMPIGWRRDQGTIVCTNSGYDSESKITVPVMPQGNYDLQVRLAMGHAHGNAGIYLPVGAGSVMLRLNGSGASGLDYVSGRSAYSNGTGSSTTFAINRVYTVDVRVTLTGDQAAIVATIDGKPLVNWSGAQNVLSPYDSMDIRCLGLHAYYTTVTYGSLRMRPAQDARIYKPDGKGAMLPRSMMLTRPLRPASTGTGSEPSGGTPGRTP